ncbi:MAG: 2-C-methyl-D-erythritol 4-phosphate cytidylyltransferase [Candidatus Melainabacteria bacterium]|nr:2-C-methyl-D-erythritol 4-phosphate cytidylyltransferase [Candidatus Melainabacteria bacterium]
MNKNKKISIIIAGAGSASRMDSGNSKSKLFVLLENKPLVIYSLEKFLRLNDVLEVIVVTNDINATRELLELRPTSCDPGKVKIVLGGKKRQDSVYNGFCKVNPTCDLVLIHDVARPLFELDDVNKCIESAYINGASVLAIPLVDTIKKSKSDKDKLVVDSTISRDELYLIQTPQVFKYDLLERCYRLFKDSSLTITDEAQMIELFENSVNLIIGNRKNIKITYPEDLEIASAILKEVKNYVRCN